MLEATDMKIVRHYLSSDSLKIVENQALPSETLSKIAEEGTLSNSFYEATVTLMQNKTKIVQKMEITGQYH